MRRGQILLVVLLGMAVMLTVGLSIASRSINEIGQATTQDESSRALSAAESGIEAAIGVGSTSGNVGTSTYTVLYSNVLDARKDSVVFGDLLAGQVATLVLYDSVGLPPTSGYALNKQINICWGNGTETPKLEAMLYYYNSLLGYKLGVLGDFVGTDGGNNPCTDYQYFKRMPLSNFGASGIPVYLRMRVLYNQTPQPLQVRANNASDKFPPQAMRVKVLGQSGSTNRVVEVTQSLGVPMGIFDQAVFSGLNLGN